MIRSPWRVLLAALTLAVVPLPATSASAHETVDRIDLPVGWQPEGVTTDGHSVFSGSLATGRILEANPRTGRTRILPESETGTPAVGLDYDRRRDLIWVAGGPSGTIKVQTAGSGRLLRTYSFPAGPARFVNDLVVTRRAVYATDSSNAVLGVVPLGRSHHRLPASGVISTLPLGGDYVQQEGFNANGIVASRHSLLVIQSNTGKLFKVNRSTGNAREVDLGGATLTNGDGLEIDGDILYVVRNQNNLVAVVDLNRRLTRGEVVDEITSDDLDVPATVALVRHSLWAANARFGGTPAEQAAKDYWLTRLPAFDD